LLPRPVRQLLIGPRNTESLRRLALIAEGRHRLAELGATDRAATGDVPETQAN
jgi:hypothetical protein